MERSAAPLFYSSSYFLRIKCHSAAHTADQKPGCVIVIGDQSYPMGYIAGRLHCDPFVHDYSQLVST